MIMANETEAGFKIGTVEYKRCGHFCATTFVFRDACCQCWDVRVVDRCVVCARLV